MSKSLKISELKEKVALSWVNHSHQIICFHSIRKDVTEEEYYLVELHSGKLLVTHPLISEVHEGLIQFGDKEMKFGFLKVTGEIVLSGYDFVDDFSNGLALTFKNEEPDKYINSLGETVIELKAGSSGTSFKDGFAWVENKEFTTYSIINLEGEVVCERSTVGAYLRNLGEGMFLAKSGIHCEIIEVKG